MNENEQREQLVRLVSNRHPMEAADAILAAGYSKPRTARASDGGLRKRLVDLLLTYKGTPRHKLFEYPHRDDDSRAMIGQAEAVALRIIHALDAPEATR